MGGGRRVVDPVIIVGAGPVGLTLALALARQEVPSVVLDDGPGKDEPRLARTVVLREDTTALVERLTGVPLDGAGVRWTGWRSMRRRQLMRRLVFEGTADEAQGGGHGGGYGVAEGTRGPGSATNAGGAGAGRGVPAEDSGDPAGAGAAGPAPLHIAQHVLTGVLRAAIARQSLVKVAVESRLDGVEQDTSGVTAHTRGPKGTWWRGSYLVGCDGPRSTVRKLQDIRFPGRTAVERYAVAALRTELPWDGEALLHRLPPWRTSGPSAGEISARPLPEGVWRLDWLLPPGKELVTPELLVGRIRETLTGWTGNATPAYELLDTGVHTVHHRLARRWRAGRIFLAGDSAHLLGALGTQGLDEGLRDTDNLAWKLAAAWHQPHDSRDALLDSYQEERRTVVSGRLRAADRALPVVRGGGGLRSYVPGSARGHDALLADGHLGQGPLGGPGAYAGSPLAAPDDEATVPVVTPPGAPVVDVTVTAEDGTFVRLRDRLGRGALLVVLVAPGTGVWARRHWMSAGIMPRLAAAVTALPYRAELLVTEGYPGAAPHTVLLVRPDGHLVTALAGVHPAALYTATATALAAQEPTAHTT
ncbi:FAD-dependent monooxygenase [Streptomyces sp. B3I8]|uniref:FAD-dependent monooxygenase n=1 Tax=Streptomyces sp. B3I8 TaxID=3042303 RepID=UPI0027856B83|nr:3-(3-hydroxy-phenyl)propionate hydroxylase [Streptomyces sp. B3I8]